MIVQLMAPQGVTSFSHDGNEYSVGGDGMVEVNAARGCAEVTRLHGSGVTNNFRADGALACTRTASTLAASATRTRAILARGCS